MTSKSTFCPDFFLIHKLKIEKKRSEKVELKKKKICIDFFWYCKYIFSIKTKEPRRKYWKLRDKGKI